MDMDKLMCGEAGVTHLGFNLVADCFMKLFYIRSTINKLVDRICALHVLSFIDQSTTRLDPR